MSVRVNIGCGRTPTEGWINFDNSPSLRLSRSPIKYFLARTFRLLDRHQIENVEWNKGNSIRFSDASKRIELADHSVDCLYSSHMIEHLSRVGAKAFLGEAKRVLKTGGVIRLSVPDLTLLAARYLEDRDADAFLEIVHMDAPPLERLRDKLKLLVSGHRHHQWMYDEKSLSRLMVDAGFRDIAAQPAGSTMIADPGALDLNERSDVSLYLEAMA